MYKVNCRVTFEQGIQIELRNDVDGDTLGMNGEAYNFKGRKWD